VCVCVNRLFEVGFHSGYGAGYRDTSSAKEVFLLVELLLLLGVSISGFWGVR
jgi:hypothetical protein